MRAALLCLAATLCLAAPTAASPAPAATPIALGPSNAIRATLAPGEAHRYTLDAVAGRTYIVETFDAALAPGHTAISAADPDGHIAASAPGAADADQTMRLVARRTGPITLAVSGAGGWSGAYAIRALARRGQPGAAWDEHGEPDAWCELATTLAPGAPRRLSLQAPDPQRLARHPDSDTLAINAEPGRRYAIALADAPPGAEALIVLADESGDLLAVAYAGPAARAIAAIPPGPRRTLCARVAASRSAPWHGAYTVELTDTTAWPRLYLPAVRGQ